MSNRAQRRAEKKIKRPANRNQQRLEAWSKNGITADDLEREYKKGFSAGYSSGVKAPMKICYAGAALACKRHLGFNVDDIGKFMAAMDDIIVEQFTTKDALEAAWKEAGLPLFFRETEDGTIIQDT